MQHKLKNLSDRKIAQLIIYLVLILDVVVLCRFSAGSSRFGPQIPGNPAAASDAAPEAGTSSYTAMMTAATTTATLETEIGLITSPAIPEATSSATLAVTPVFPGIDPVITSQWIFPMKTEPTTPTVGVFGAGRTSKRLHAGIDLYSPDGTEIYAMAAGRVQNIIVFYENLMAIEVVNHDGATIRYCELTPSVKIGDKVDLGQLLGKLKKNSDGTCMLHLELYAAAGSAALTQTKNKHYLYVSTRYGTFMRREDLVDPSGVYGLPRP
ncbi:MAG: M23 family metallopeptidase [Clostridiaceae bacterium]|nr:M23 family metallopeptidase [Clostridiaceae bacterium]